MAKVPVVELIRGVSSLNVLYIKLNKAPRAIDRYGVLISIRIELLLGLYL